LAARKGDVQIAKVLFRGQKKTDPKSVAKAAMIEAGSEGSLDAMMYLV